METFYFWDNKDPNYQRVITLASGTVDGNKLLHPKFMFQPGEWQTYLGVFKGFIVLFDNAYWVCWLSKTSATIIMQPLSQKYADAVSSTAQYEVVKKGSRAAKQGMKIYSIE